ncbi:MAG: hypothetical protein ABJA18_00930 [bacterium]
MVAALDRPAFRRDLGGVSAQLRRARRAAALIQVGQAATGHTYA